MHSRSSWSSGPRVSAFSSCFTATSRVCANSPRRCSPKLPTVPQSIGSNYVRYQLFQQGLFIGTELSHVHGPYEAQKVARMHAFPQRQAGGVAHAQTGQKFRVDGECVMVCLGMCS